jgi:hypothetical protein
MISNNANAGIIFEDTTDVTRNYQIYNNDFDITGFEDYTNITLNVNVRGDYGDVSGESIRFFLNNDFYGVFNSNSPGVTAEVTRPIFSYSKDTTMSFSVSVTPGTFLKYNYTFSNKYNLFRVSWGNGDRVRSDSRYEKYVSWNLSGDPKSVPEPSTLAILALGMIGLASRRFKKK